MGRLSWRRESCCKKTVRPELFGSDIRSLIQ